MEEGRNYLFDGAEIVRSDVKVTIKGEVYNLPPLTEEFSKILEYFDRLERLEAEGKIDGFLTHMYKPENIERLKSTPLFDDDATYGEKFIVLTEPAYVPEL